MAEPAAQSYTKLQGEQPLAGARLQAEVSPTGGRLQASDRV